MKKKQNPLVKKGKKPTVFSLSSILDVLSCS
jgi:hypothetical protein